MSNESKPEKNKETGRFLAGNTGGGRRKGSRNKLGEQFLSALQQQWEEHGKAALVEARESMFDKYEAALQVSAGPQRPFVNCKYRPINTGD